MKIKEFIEKYQIPYMPIYYYIDPISKKKNSKGERNNLSQEEILLYTDKILNLKKQNNIDEDDHVVYNYKKDILMNKSKNDKRCYSIFLKYSNIACIDIDDENIKSINDLDDKYDLIKKSYYVKGNTKGIHIYIKIDNLPEYTNEKKIGKFHEIDLIKNKNNMWEQIKKEVYNDELTTINFDDIKHLFNIENMNIKNDMYKKDILPINTPINPPIICESKPSYTMDNIHTKKDLLLFIIQNLNPKRASDFNDWLCVGMALRPYDDINLWIEFSKRDTKSFNSPNNDQLMIRNWEKFRTENCYNIIALLYWLKKDNINVYNNLKDIYENFLEEEMFYLSHTETTKYLIKNIFHNKIFYNKLNSDFYILNYDIFIYQIIDIERLEQIIYKFLDNYILKNSIILSQKEKDNLLCDKNIKNIVSNIKKECLNEDIDNLLDSEKHFINFKNGKLNLKTLEFSNRTENDFFSLYLDYDYNNDKIPEIENHIKNMLIPIFNDNESLFQDILTFYGYAITGEKSHADILFNIGYGGGNGKTFIFEIFRRVFSCYVSTTDKDTFKKNGSENNISKSFHKLLKSRILFCEEFEEDMNLSLIKNLSGSDTIEWKILNKKKSVDIKHCIKLIFTANKDPNFKSDLAMNRRGRLIKYKNEFLTKEKYEKLEDKKGKYISNPNLKDLFDDIKYKNSFINLLIPYSKKFYDTNQLIYINDLQGKFEKVNDENDDLQPFFNDKIIYTKDINDIINKKELYDYYKCYMNYKNCYSFLEFFKSVKKYKNKYFSKYDDQKYKNGKGCYIGMKFIIDNDNNNIDI